MMMKTPLALSTAIALGAAGAAFAQQQQPDPAIEGTIESVDPGTSTVVLDDGRSYRLGEGIDMESMHEGSRVTLSCDDTGANCMVMSAGTTGESGTEAQSPEEQAEPSAGPAPGSGKSDLPGLDQGRGGGGPQDGIQNRAGNPTAEDADSGDAASDTAASAGSISDQLP